MLLKNEPVFLQAKIKNKKGKIKKRLYSTTS